MSGETVTANEADKEAGADKGRQRSTISFPYVDLGAAIELANAIYGNVGMGECEDDQLAAWTNQSPKSSGYREQMRAARMADLVEGTNGKHKLTPLGRSIADPSQAVAAKTRAFLNVPLFNAVFEKYRGGVLPPAAALERDLVTLGVAEKQKGRARQVLERSAEQAGFTALGKNRLVMPGIAMHEEAPGGGAQGGGDETPNDLDKRGAGGGNGGGGHSDLHPFIQGLLKTLPDPEKEKDWPLAQRVKWLQTAANIFDLIYEGEGGIEVRAATAQRSPRPND